MIQTMWKSGLIRTTALATTWFFSMSATANAVCSQPHPRVCAEFFHSDAVFTGTVISVRNGPKRETNPDGWFYRVKVTRSYRGSNGHTVDIFTGNDSGRFPLQEGHMYLLFAYKEEGILKIDNCGNSAELSEAGEAIRQVESVLANMKSASGGDIGGRVVGEQDAGTNGIAVTASGGGKKYTGVTDRDGRFHIHVPPGKYVVWPETSQWIVTPYDLSYDKEDHVLVERGSCAELQFLASPK
jgi:hypothetical protein